MWLGMAPGFEERLSMFHQDDDHITALHEIYHCGFAASQGLAIMEVNVPEAISFINFPLPAYGLQRQWASDAPGCLRAMVATIVPSVR